MGFFDSLVEGIGKGVDSLISHRQAKENQKDQYRFAREGIQMRVRDAKAAGIHPLFALGANTSSFSPISVGSDFGGMGQSLGRAVAASANGDERKLQLQGVKLELENKQLQNDILRAKLASDVRTIRQGAGVAPPKVSDYMLGGKLIKGNPGFSDAQVIENRHGDLAGSLYGLVSMPADYTHNKPTGKQIEDTARYIWNELFGTNPAH